MALYANDYAGLTAANQNDERARQAAFLQSFATMIDQLNRKRDIGIQQAQQNREFGYRTGRDVTGDTFRNQQSIIQQSQFDRDLALRRDEMKAREDKSNPTAERAREFNFRNAIDDAGSGLFSDPTHVRSLYPSLTPDEAAIMAHRSMLARDEIGSQYAVAKRAADVVNRKSLVDAYTQSYFDRVAKATGKPTDSLTPFTPSNDDIAQFIKKGGPSFTPVLAARAKYGKLADAVLKDKTLSTMIQADPETGKYVPSIPRPKWLAMEDAPGAAVAKTSGTGTTRQYPDWFYGRVNQYIGAGLDPRSAKTRALMEMQALQANP